MVANVINVNLDSGISRIAKYVNVTVTVNSVTHTQENVSDVKSLRLAGIVINVLKAFMEIHC